MCYVYVLFDNCYSLEFDNPERPECNNLLSIYQLISGRTKEVCKCMCIFIFPGCLSAIFLLVEF